MFRGCQLAVALFICLVSGKVLSSPIEPAGNNEVDGRSTGSKPKNVSLLVISGFEPAFGDWTRSVQIVDPRKEGDSSSRYVQDYPLITASGTAQNFGNGLIVSCGDHDPVCYQYTPQGWRNFAALSVARRWVTSVLIGEVGSEEMWVLGGNNYEHNLLSTEIINPKTRRVRPGPNLPAKMQDHCAAKINQTHVFISHGNYAKAYIVDVSRPDNFQFHRLPDPIEWRFGGECALIRLKEGGLALMIAGGGFPTRLTTEFLRLEGGSGEWEEGPWLPHGFGAGGSVNPDDQTFILTGGITDYTLFADVVQLDLDAMEFVTMPGKLKYPRDQFTITWVQESDL